MSRLASKNNNVKTSVKTNEDTSWFLSGTQIREASAAEKQLAKERKEKREKGVENIQRFSFGKNERDVVKKVIILDETTETVVLKEHEVWDEAERGFKHFLCTKAIDGVCPVCDDGHKINSMLFLTVLEVLDEPYVSSKGVVHKAFKKLLAVKKSQHDQFFSYERLVQNPANPLKTTRGLLIHLKRTAEDTAPRTGVPVLVPETGMMYEKQYTEEELIAEFPSDEVKSKDGTKTIKPKNHLIMAYNYAEMFKKPSAAGLEIEYGKITPGSSAYTARLDEDIYADVKASDTTSATAEPENPFDN